MPRKVAVVYGGWSPEAEISRKGGKAVASALRRLGFEVGEFELSPDIANRLPDFKPDFVFPLLHGRPGEDGSFQGLLEILKIPYVGESVKVSSLCMDKDWTKKLLREAGVRVPRGVSLKKEEDLERLEGWESFPAVVKPAEGGSSIGMKIVENRKALTEAAERLLRRGEKVLVEEFIPGREYTCGFVSGRVFTPLEIRPKGGIYDFETKYTEGGAEFIPEKSPLGEKIKRLTLEVVEALEIENLCRVDFRYNTQTGELFVLEVNTIPGMTETSLLPTMAKVDGLTFEELIGLIISAKGFYDWLSSNFVENEGNGSPPVG